MEMEQATEGERAPRTAQKMLELVMEIPRLTYEMIEMTGATPFKLFAFLPEGEQEKYIQLLHKEYPGFEREYWGEFFTLPIKAYKMGLATTLLRWLGDEEEYWKDVEESKELGFFYWKRWVIDLHCYNPKEIRFLLENFTGSELKTIAANLS